MFLKEGENENKRRGGQRQWTRVEEKNRKKKMKRMDKSEMKKGKII